ncbi:uncharacterized protein LOC108680263 isoform X2 [Hyalella azteca]|uniref:Uncharacterized protein LOC108680263 isoform X2 n=1 Tax=Hyalella azteca TaxID=294128 RepID=A0A8B7PEW9_HYAAZ|nr:uncharacterized protein LOC108680263 isoform X2 [Hyalella azteca]
MTSRKLLAVVLLSSFVCAAWGTFSPRRILFAQCDYPEHSVKPKAVFMTCANNRGVCEVRAGGSHTLRAIFVPKINSSDVDSYVRWNSWVEVQLPGQNRDACGEALTCPVVANDITRFTYNLDIQNFWPRDEYPVIWSLTDRATDQEIVCFKFRINIV